MRAAWRAPVSPPDSSEGFGAAVVRVARRVRWQGLLACALTGALGVPLGWLVADHRIILVAIAVVVGAFGAGGLADRVVRDERSSPEPDRILVVGFAAIRWVSVVAGTSAAITVGMWLLFTAMGGSHLTWH